MIYSESQLTKEHETQAGSEKLHEAWLFEDWEQHIFIAEELQRLELKLIDDRAPTLRASACDHDSWNDTNIGHSFRRARASIEKTMATIEVIAPRISSHSCPFESPFFRRRNSR